MDINRELFNKIAIIITILGLPSVVVLYFGLGSKLKKLLNLNRDNYISKRKRGIITFDYSNNNGKYSIGDNGQFFELKFSKASGTSIHVYNDPSSIVSVALVKEVSEIGRIKDASKYDTSSRVRTPLEGQIVVLQNAQGNYCAIKIIDIKDDTRGDKNDEITFEYVINAGGYKDFGG